MRCNGGESAGATVEIDVFWRGKQADTEDGLGPVNENCMVNKGGKGVNEIRARQICQRNGCESTRHGRSCGTKFEPPWRAGCCICLQLL